MSELIDKQIKELLDKAAEKPGPNDPMNMVGFGRTLLAAKMVALRARQKLARGEKIDYGERKEDGNNSGS